MADISLLFDVQREGGVGQGSDATIRAQLQDIVNSINAKPFKIQFEADTSSLRKQIEDTAKATQSTKKQQTGAKQASQAYQEATQAITRYYAKLKQLNLAEKEAFDTYNKTGNIDKQYVGLIAELNQLKTAYDNAIASASSMNETERSQLTTLDTVKQLELASAIERRTNAVLQNNAAMSSSQNVLNQTNATLARCTKAEHSHKQSSRDAVTAIREKMAAVIQAQNAVKMGASSDEEAAAKVRVLQEATKELRFALKENYAIIQQNGDATKGLGEHVVGLGKKFTAWFGISQLIMAAYRAIRKMITAVIELDTAMTELKKVTDETDETYQRFLENASTRAKKLGASLTDVVKTTADFARLGFTIDEAETISDAALVYKNVGDGIEDIDQASESLISTMQAFGVEAGEVMSIVDKFNITGNKFAISSGGVGDALLNSAAALNAAGNSLDESIGLITAANTTIQDPEKVGTALKTVSMYLRAAKTEAEDAGESTDGMANSISELRGELLSLTGNKVDIQIDDNRFKSTYDILKDLSEVWDELSDISRANITEMIGGKRNANVISALLKDFEKAEAVVTQTANSSGSAMAENEKVIESIQGKLNILSATFETFSQDLIGSGTIKFFVEFATGVLNVLDAFTKLNMLLPAIIGNFLIFKSIGIAKNLADMKAQVSVLTTQLVAEKGVTEQLTTAVYGLTLAEKQELAAQLQQAVVDGAINQTEKDLILTKLGLTGATTSLTVANKGLAASFKTVAASVPVWGWISLAITVVIEAVVGLVSWLGNTADGIAELDNELDDLISTAQTAANEFSNLKQSADGIIPRFAELAKGVNEFGEKVDLTDEEYAEFLELNNKIAEMFPELDLGLDSNGNHILALSYSVDSLTESLEALVEAERAAANEEIAGNMKDTLKNIKKANKEYDKQIAKYQEPLNEWYDMEQYTKGSTDNWNDEDIIAAAEKIGVEREKIQDLIEFVPAGEHSGYYNWDKVFESNDIKNAISSYEKQIDNLEKKQAARWENLNPIMGAWLQTTDDYAAAEDNVQQLLTKIIGNVDYSEIGITNEKKLKTYMTDNFIEPISEAEPEVQNAMIGLFDIKSAFDSGALTVGEYGIMDYILGDLESAGVNEKILSNLNDALNLDEFKSQLEAVKNGINATDEEALNFVNDLTFEDFNLVYSVIQEQGSMSIEELKEQIKLLRYEGANMVEPLNMTEFIDGLNETANAVDKVTSAMAKLKEGTTLSKKEIVDLINQYPQLLQQADIFANGSVEAQKNALNAILDMQEQEYDAQIDAKIAELEATEQVLNNQLELEEQKANLINEIKNLEVNGKVTQEEDFLNKLNELNDLQGQNYVSLKDGELQVNEEALNDQLAMGSEFGEKSAENIWEPYGETIVASHSQGYTGALTATNNYTSSLLSRIKNFISGLGSAIATAWSDMWSGNWQGIGAYFSQVTSTGSNSVSGGTVSVNFGGTKTTINGQDVDEWISDQEAASKTRIAKTNNIKAGVLNSIKNLEDLKGLSLTDIYASSSSSGSSSKDSDEDEENIFKTMYDYHKHLVAMEQETTADFLKWLDDAYKTAYKQGEITLDEYYKYEEEVFKGLQDIRDEAKDALDDLIDYRVDMLKQEIEDEKDAYNERLDNLKEFYDKQKEMLQDKYDEEKYLEDQAEKRKSVSDIKAELNMLSNDDSAWAQKRKLELQEELTDAEKDLADFEKENALDKALDAIDEAYNSQEAQLQREMEALDEKLNDPNALFNQALEDIKNNSKNQLYYQMLEYNRQRGDGNDETVKKLWESTYGALDEYEKMFGELYQGVKLKNETGYKSTATSTSTSSSNKSNKTSTANTTTTTSKSQSSSPSLSKGSNITVKKTATNFSSKSGNKKMASFVPGGSYTVYQTSGDQVLIGRNGVYTGWIKKSDIVGYASGTKHATAGLHELYEQGSETLFVSSSGGKYRILSDGDKVLNAKATNFLYDFANGGENALAQMLKNVFGGTAFSGITPSVINNEINMGDIVITGSANQKTVSEIRREQRSSVDYMLKELNKLNK